MHKFFLLFLISGTISLPLSAQMSQMEAENVVRMIEFMPNYESVIESLKQQDYQPDIVQLGSIRVALWNKLVADQSPAAKENFEQGKCIYGEGKTGYFSLKTKGERPEYGYPVYIGLHGGGGGPQEMNDRQWGHMKNYYLNSIESGIYVAPRGPNNTWNLHFDADAELFYNQLLKNLRLFADIDLNRIYLLGYSAGGDGVYQLAPRMAPQLAATNMSAGHHNGVSPDNLHNLPMLLQVGELDAAYKRNTETVRYSLLLDNLAERFPDEFTHQLYVHANAEHSYVLDRQGPLHRSPVLADPQEWLIDPNIKYSTAAITDAPTWLSQFWRDPFPTHIRWNTQTVLPGNQDWYWISVDNSRATNPEKENNDLVELRMLRNQNRIEIDAFHGVLELHLSEHEIDLQIPVVVAVDGREFEFIARPSVLEMALTMAERMDPVYSFWQTVKVWRDDAGVVWVE